jgi:hypothetical protein
MVRKWLTLAEYESVADEMKARRRAAKPSKAQARRMVAMGLLRTIRSRPGGGKFLRGLRESSLMVHEVGAAMREWLLRDERYTQTTIDDLPVTTAARLLIGDSVRCEATSCETPPAPASVPSAPHGLDYVADSLSDALSAAERELKQSRSRAELYQRCVRSIVRVINRHPNMTVGKYRTVLLKRSIVGLIQEASAAAPREELDYALSLLRAHMPDSPDEIADWHNQLLADIQSAALLVS